MSSISDEGRKIALEKYGVRLLPSSTDKSQLIAASVIFGPFQPGQYITISINENSYIATGDETTVATNADVLLSAGVHDFAIPTGVTHLALISSEVDAVAAVWAS